MKTCLQILKQKKHQDVISIPPSGTVFDALVLLDKYRIGALAVIEDDKLVGMFSERDYARKGILKGNAAKFTLIADVMTSKVFSAKPNDLVDYCMSLMSDNRIRHLPILDNEKVIGVLSAGDFVKETISYQQDLIKQLEMYVVS